MVGRICGAGKFLLWSGTLKEGEQKRVLTMKIKNSAACKKRWQRGKLNLNRIQKVDTRQTTLTRWYMSKRVNIWFSERSRLVHPPLFPLLHLLHLLLFLYFSFSFIGLTYFLLLSIPSLSTRIVPLRFQAGGRRKRPNLGLVWCVWFVLSVFLS